MTVISLTGGIASGKSTAAHYLSEQGAHVIDADLLGHRTYEPGMPSYDQVVATFGSDVIASNGQIDRKALGGKVFGQPDQLKKLTDIVWPQIRSLAEAEISQVRGQDAARIIVLEAAVLFEAGWDDIGDETWVVTVERETAIARAMARDNVPREAIVSRLDAQLSNAERRARATVVIENDSDQAALLRALETHWRRVSG